MERKENLQEKTAWEKKVGQAKRLEDIFTFGAGIIVPLVVTPAAIITQSYFTNFDITNVFLTLVIVSGSLITCFGGIAYSQYKVEKLEEKGDKYYLL